MNIVTLATALILFAILYRTLVPWLREQATIAKALVDSGEEPPDLEEELKKRLIKLGYLDPNEEE